MLTEDDAYELLAFLIASADTALVEPAFYGPRRLLDAAQRLAASMSDHVAPEHQAWLAEFVAAADQEKGWSRRDPARFQRFIASSAGGVAGELKQRAALPSIAGAEVDA
ncbi:MAG: DUF6092 family protein [Chloroflexota bacterium]|nr:DUF6092 family protein [Chloroflexota bacterium]